MLTDLIPQSSRSPGAATGRDSSLAGAQVSIGRQAAMTRQSAFRMDFQKPVI